MKRPSLFHILLLVASMAPAPAYFACAHPKPDLTLLDDAGLHEYKMDQFVKVVNDVTSAAITAAKTGVLKKDVEVQILIVNRQILDYVEANPQGTRAQLMTIITNGQQALPPNLQAEFTQYLQQVLDFLNGVKQ